MPASRRGLSSSARSRPFSLTERLVRRTIGIRYAQILMLGCGPCGPCRSDDMGTPAKIAQISPAWPGELDHLAHFSVSSARSFPKSAATPQGPSAHSCNPRLDLRIGHAALISPLSFLITSTGVFRGAPIPNRPLASKPGTKSPTVWSVPGSASERVTVVNRSGRSRWAGPVMDSI